MKINIYYKNAHLTGFSAVVYALILTLVLCLRPHFELGGWKNTPLSKTCKVCARHLKLMQVETNM